MSFRSFRCVWLVALVGSALFGCRADSTDEAVTSGADSGPGDGSVTDTGELGAGPALDSGADVSKVGLGGCKTNADCASDPSGKFCLSSTDGGKSYCVPCLPGPFDECGPGTYCNDMTYTCEEGCKTTADCKVASGGDAGADGSTDAVVDAAGETGAASLVCDPSEHRCVPGG